jgi:type I restriction enzyme S subunit
VSSTDIPAQWVKDEAGTVFKQVSTSTKKVKTKDCDDEGKYPVIDQGQLPIAGYVNDDDKVIQVESPLVIFGDHTRVIKWVQSDFVPGADGTTVLDPIGYLYPRYFYYHLRAIELPDKGYARHFKFLKESVFFIPPFAEQKQIAAKLDELLAQVDSIKTRLDAIPAILKRFRQSVLAAAVSGRLTEEWRKDSDYVESPVGDGWKWAPIPASWGTGLYPELVESRLGKMLDKAKNTGMLTRYLGNISVRWFGFNLTNLQEIRVSAQEQMELSLRPGDVLICEGGEPGRSAVWLTNNDNPIIFQKALHRARVGNRILPDWLVFNLKNDADSRTLEQLFTGTTIKHLTGKSLKIYPVRVPPIEEQTEIVRRVEQLFTFADQIEQRVKDAQSRVNHLTQSILAKAFRGELTADWREQNSDLISGEYSAQALLERIKAEQAKLKPKKTVRKKRSA